MITNVMKKFMEEAKMGYEYNWFTDEEHPELPESSNKPGVAMIIGVDKDPNEVTYLLNNGTNCTKAEYNDINNEYDEDYFYEIIEDNEESDSSIEGILNKNCKEITPMPQMCEPGHLKYVLREFEICDDFNMEEPLIVFYNNAGDYGSPEIDEVLSDDNCKVIRCGELSYHLGVFLNKIPEDRRVHLIVCMSTCLDT